MYEIILTIRDIENDSNYKLVYDNIGFKSMEDACNYLGNNYNHILKKHDIDGEIIIKYNFNRLEIKKWE